MSRPSNGEPMPRSHRDCGCPPAGGLSRRGFLRGMTAAGALTALASPVLSTRVAFAADGTYSGDTIIVLSLRGGFDGLNAVVPYGDPDYLRARPDLAIPTSALLEPTGMFGLHPAMAALVPHWRDGSFGVVHAVGHPDRSRSHFQAMGEMERAAPGSSVRTGWLDRVVGLQATGTIFRAVSMGGGNPPQAFVGPAPEVAFSDLNSFVMAADSDDPVALARWARTLRAMQEGASPAQSVPAAQALQAVGTATRLRDPGGEYPVSIAPYRSDSDLHKALRDVAKLIKAGVGMRVVTVDYGDWDMHEGMGRHDQADGWLRLKLEELSTALVAFASDLGAARMASVTLVTLSEFGRRVQQNESMGVDHGHGNAVMVFGGGAVGGRVHLAGGRWPGLSPAALDDGDLKGTLDYRLVLAELLTRRARMTSGQLAAVLPGVTPATLGIFKNLGT